ncbi:MAG: hypothetical protein ACRDAM_04210, partial [Casimicrobium sp.]
MITSGGAEMMQSSLPPLPVLDPNEAPEGFYAVPKSDVVAESLGNICRACDWRSACNGFEHRCMPYTVISASDGRELKRQDGCSVVFKRRLKDDLTG